MARKFVLEKGTHRVETTVAAEAVQLKAHGYREVTPVPVPAPPAKTTKTND